MGSSKERRDQGPSGSSASSKTRDELYEQAQQQHVPGRSQMDGEELAEAVDEQ